MNIKKVISSLALVGAVFGLSAVPAFAANTVVKISGNTSAGENQPGWLFNRDVSTSTPYTFNTNAASIGLGSLYVLPIGANESDKFIAENFINSPIANINSISYDFRIGNGGNASDADQFYMSVYANFGSSSPTKFYDCRYNVVPTVGSTAGFTTVTFDPSQSYPVTQSGSSPFVCPAKPVDMNVASAGSRIRVFALNVGDTSASDQGLDGYLDKVVVSTPSDVTTYDFEPSLTPISKDQCKNNGWMNFNNPSFKNQGKCIDYVENHDHKIKGNNLQYMAGGLLRYADFEMNVADQKGDFEYKDGNKGSYKVKVSVVRVDNHAGYFAGVVTKASNPSWVGQWLFAKVVDGAPTPDSIWGSFTNQTAATNGVINMSTPADGPFAITHGKIKVN